jgi:hypothetical protein
LRRINIKSAYFLGALLVVYVGCFGAMPGRAISFGLLLFCNKFSALLLASACFS